MTDKTTDNHPLLIGWADADITPDKPVLLAGQFNARVSEGVLDKVTVTALALDSGNDAVIMASCDLVVISEILRDTVRARIKQTVPDIDPKRIILNATHTHTAPQIRSRALSNAGIHGWPGVDIPVMPADEYIGFAAERIADAIYRAWDARSPGKIAFGQGYAVVGRNRRWTNTAGKSTMYGNTDTPDFSHIEGYEDHSVNLLATRDSSNMLTGLIVNLAAPSQETENLFSISADYWHDTRKALRNRFGDSIHVLAQCSAAGDQSPHLIYDTRADERMLKLKGRTRREEIANRIADAVEDTIGFLDSEYDDSVPITHVTETLELPLSALTQQDADTASREVERYREQYKAEKQKLDADPTYRHTPRWYVPLTSAYNHMQWWRGVLERFEHSSTHPTQAVEIHVVRLGNIVFATNPFEYYLDFGIYIKARSRAVQTFIVQLAGQGTYVPTTRSVSGGGYGAISASNPVGPDGGRQLAERTIAIIDELWETT